ncbi:hypothetical protein JTB14_017594 [Gonioctena quinquepunctata]|nr:hypothetical protein JTB14_017594 [Gonioctena quinquepunctata]
MPNKLVIVPGSQDEIKSGTQLCDMKVRFEYQRKKKRMQCYNCQRFEHSAHYCKTDPVCRHCAGQHESLQHNNKDAGPHKYSNCEGPALIKLQP